MGVVLGALFAGSGAPGGRKESPEGGAERTKRGARHTPKQGSLFWYHFFYTFRMIFLKCYAMFGKRVNQYVCHAGVLSLSIVTKVCA